MLDTMVRALFKAIYKILLIDRIWKYTAVILLTLLVLITVISASVGVLQPLMGGDDFAYCNSIAKYRDPFTFAGYWYHTWSGRLTTLVLHWIALHDVVTRAIFGTLNGLLFIALGWLMVALAVGRRPRLLEGDGILVALTVTALWFLTPAIDEVAFWRTGADAYLWSVVTGLLFLLPYRLWVEHPTTTKNPWRTVGFFIAGVLVGMNGEQTVAALAVIIPCWLLFRAPRPVLRNLPAWLVLGFVGLLIGGFISASGPGNYHRLEYGDPLTLHVFLKGAISYGTRLFVLLKPALFVWAPLAVLTYCTGSLLVKRRWVVAEWILGALAAAGIMLLLPRFQEDRTLFLSFVLLLIALASVIELQRVHYRQLRPVCYALAMVAIVLTLLSGLQAFSNARFLALTAKGRAEEVARQQKYGITDIAVPPYLHPEEGRLPYVSDITCHKRYWTNLAAAHFYGITYIQRW